MKSLKLLAIAAIFGAFVTSCEADSINEEEQLMEEVDFFNGTGNDSDSPEDPGGN